MNHLTIHIAYSADNELLAQEIVKELSTDAIEFVLINGSQFGETEDFLEKLTGAGKSVIFLISDNFLKTVSCMRNCHLYLQTLRKKGTILPVITDGVYQQEDGSTVQIPTEFARVSNVIKYMNFWQEKYLDLRKQRRDIAQKEEAIFKEKLKTVRIISSEVGEFLRDLRDHAYFSEYEFKANYFEVFFKYFGTEATYLAYVSEPKAIDIDADSLEPQGDELQMSDSDDHTDGQLPEVTDSYQDTIAASANGSSSKEIINVITTADYNEDLIVEESVAEDLYVNQNRIDPEWNETEAISIVEEGTLNDISDTEKLAMELAEVLPQYSNTQLPEVGDDVVTLEDLVAGKSNKRKTMDETDVGTDKSVRLSSPIQEQEEDYVTNLDLLSDLPSDKTAHDSHLVEEEEEDEELEAYFIDEEEEEEDLEEVALNEYEILQSANALVQSGKVKEGITLLEATLADVPDFLSVRYQYAAFLAQYQNRFEEATEQLAILLEHDPNNLSAKFFLGELAEADRDYLSAKSYFEWVYMENPEFPNVAYKLGLLHINYFRENPKQAQTYLKEAYQLNPNNINALYQQGILLNEVLEEKEAAIDCFKEALEKAPEHPFVNYDLALIYHEKGITEQALTYYEAACAINPELKTVENDQAFAIAPIANPAISLTELSAEIENRVAQERLQEQLAADSTDTSNGLDVSIDTNETENAVHDELESMESTIEHNLTGKTILITGTDTVVAKSIAELFACKGFSLILVGKSTIQSTDWAQQLEDDFGVKLRFLETTDLTEVLADGTTIDILININNMLFQEQEKEKAFDIWKQQFDKGLEHNIQTIQNLIPLFEQLPPNQVINVYQMDTSNQSSGWLYKVHKHIFDALIKAAYIDFGDSDTQANQIATILVEYSDDTQMGDLGLDNLKLKRISEAIYLIANQSIDLNVMEVKIF